jgi:putative ABC transport system ATP-binding protein
VLELRHVVKHYHLGGNPIYAIDDVSMTVVAGEVVALYGPSGSGKTTLVELVAGLKAPDRGSIIVDGRDVAKMSRKEANGFRLNDLGMVLQPSSLQPGVRAITSASIKLMSSGARSARDQIRPLMVELGLGERLYHRVSQLSMGERQRVLIALALSREPKLVLADEPTASLDTENTRRVLGLLRGMCLERNMALLLVTHDPEAASYADRTYELRDGHLNDRRPPDPSPVGFKAAVTGEPGG